jgi:hypothetical protein
VAESHLQVRLDALRKAQNADGGWGYFKDKQSWLEPTVYAALALHGDSAADRAWNLLKSWQSGQGGLRPSSEVAVESWGASLFVTLAAARGDWGDPARKAVDWLVGMEGVESQWINRFAKRVGWLKLDRDLTLKGWPWKPDTSSWVEPTAHALVALKKAARQHTAPEIQERIRLGQARLLDVRCRDGGWNYGSPDVLHVDLPSYPETTGLGLLGLQKRTGLQQSLDLALKMLAETPSPLARAWLAISLRLHGMKIPDANPPAASPDLQITALEALALPEGNYRLLETEAIG